MNNPEIPAGTTAHIDPKDIKWEAGRDLISRSVLKNYARTVLHEDNATNFSLLKMFDEIIDNAPAAEPERPKGEWLKYLYYAQENRWECICSICGKLNQQESNFCPNCGADLRGDTE